MAGTFSSRLKVSVLLILISVGTTFCKKSAADDDIVLLPQSKEIDVSYGADAKNKMDVFLPAGRTDDTPLILIVHGGTWTSGDKSDLTILQDSLMKRGMASASINYRFASSSVRYTEMLKDIDDAINYCYGRSSDWKTRNSKIVILGHSAGAHLGLLYSYTSTGNKVGAVISAAGPTDFTEPTYFNYGMLLGLSNNVALMGGFTFNPAQPMDPKLSLISPAKFIKNIPTLLIHGDADPLVLYSQAQLLDQALTTAGYTHKLVKIAGGDHVSAIGAGNAATTKLVLDEVTGWAKLYGK